ncbi:MAG: DUF1080 domain-containing protein [Chitinophagaceae bacterium]|nr:DUF1080 domain-containing protein [Chitinophagaceae bacterium]MCA6470509.1 DUF1080 domain-containing protein [Chitinophagaceae bacterium]MCA6478420.1 DUF1080 domain-containing protein [Chitinophagaceae bacterium]MCA6480277.1 DUF1080 domain-containing protein [Chitinophagaceae bacterium]
MKKIILLTLLLSSYLISESQEDAVGTVLKSFPYLQTKDISSVLSLMDQWDKQQWIQLISNLDQVKKSVATEYAINAYVNHATQKSDLNATITSHLSTGLKNITTNSGKKFLLQQLSLLGNEKSIVSIRPLLKDAALSSDAARTIATIGGRMADKVLKKASGSSNLIEKTSAQSALQYLSAVNTSLPETPAKTSITPDNEVQQLLQLQDHMEKANLLFQKKQILIAAGKIKGIRALAFTRSFLKDPQLQSFVAPVVIRQVLNDPTLNGPLVTQWMQEAQQALKGEDSSELMKLSQAQANRINQEPGFISLFNGKDLSGWQGLVGNPISRSKMTPEQLATAQAKANESARQDWVVKDGLLIFTGHGDNLATVKKYRNFEMWVDWKITEKGDAGIYLRGSPQVQIWDTSRREVGAQVGSGGLYNNTIHPSKPTQVADNPIGSWNTFRIIMRGEKVTVFLNGKKVTDEVTLENYWNRQQAIFPEEQIELQAHGTYVAYRNIFLKELPDEEDLLDSREKAEGFYPLFNGKDLTGWTGNLNGYQAEDGMIVVHPEKSSGNLYTENTYADFVLRFDFQLTPGANNGIGIRAPLSGDAAYLGMEIQVLDNEHPKYAQLQPYQYHGSVYGVIPAKRGFLLPAGQWNTEEISIRGDEIKVTLNGTVITEGNLSAAGKNGTMDHKEHPGLLRKEGHIGFLGHGDVVRFKNIRIKKM